MSYAKSSAQTYNDLGYVPGELERSEEEMHASCGRDDNQELHEKQGKGVEIRFLVPVLENAWGDDHVWQEANGCRVNCRAVS